MNWGLSDKPNSTKGARMKESIIIIEAPNKCEKIAAFSGAKDKNLKLPQSYELDYRICSSFIDKALKTKRK